jgi:5-methylcytosine-specific restriction endonuclease McrA
MSRSFIPQTLRKRVARQARYRCGYCLTQEAVVGTPMEIEHLLPEALGGLTEELNLWLACALCAEHFRWSDQYAVVLGQTPTGRATVVGLHLNRPTLVRARRLWVQAGWHPPHDEDSV